MRRRLFQSRHALLLAVLFFFAPAGRAASDFFTNGLKAAQQGNFLEATAAFESALKQHPSSGALVNLGMAEWQRGHAGTAILAWERAAWLDPRDARARQNLVFARVVAQVDAPEWRWHEKLSTALPAGGWLWAAGAGLWLAAGALVLPRVWRWKKSGGPQALAALGFCLFLLALVANAGVVSRLDFGVVLKKNTPLQLTPTRTGEVVSTLAAGETARRVRSRGNFYFIRTATAAGWVARENFGLVVEK